MGIRAAVNTGHRFVPGKNFGHHEKNIKAAGATADMNNNERQECRKKHPRKGATSWLTSH
jgi:hypothetical protein